MGLGELLGKFKAKMALGGAYASGWRCVELILDQYFDGNSELGKALEKFDADLQVEGDPLWKSIPLPVRMQIFPLLNQFRHAKEAAKNAQEKA